MAAGALPQVDVPTAKELLEQIHQHVSPEEIDTLVAELADKARAMQERLLAAPLDGTAVRGAIERTFVGRRRASAILGARGDAAVGAWVEDLLSGPEPVAVRFERFCASTGSLSEDRAAELASELLHFTAPERHPLWARWVWSTESRTGALPLLIGEDYELEADGLGASYERVGAAIAALHDSPEAGAFRRGGGGRLGTDVMLACTYGVYMRTVLGLKMTQEFNALVPPMAQLVRRLLGTYSGHREEVR
ncbi:MAG TPA: hypothetical protein VFN87_14190 [Solirubrobacteraceae bacterium]|nr:hypothetical protein [Solirubrobacteraceae bacterium]